MFRDRDFSAVAMTTSASRLFFGERRPPAVTDDESLIVAAHIGQPIGVVPGRCMGLFRNTAPS